MVSPWLIVYVKGVGEGKGVVSGTKPSGVGVEVRGVAVRYGIRSEARVGDNAG